MYSKYIEEMYECIVLTLLSLREYSPISPTNNVIKVKTVSFGKENLNVVLVFWSLYANRWSRPSLTISNKESRVPK